MSFSLKLHMGKFLPPGIYNFNARVIRHANETINLIDGLISTCIIVDYYDYKKAAEGKLKGIPYSS